MFDPIRVLFESGIVHRVAFDGTYKPSRPETNMQTTTSLNSSEVAHNAYVVRIRRPRTTSRSQQQRAVPSAAVHRSPSKWTAVAAFILAVALHAGAVMWVEMQQAKPTLEADAPVLIHSMEQVPEPGAAADARARTAAD